MACSGNSGENSVVYTMSVIGGKWKLFIIYLLSQSECMRYGELKRRIPGITHKMLSAQLKGLEKDKVILRKEFPQIPPKVEYSLTKGGISLMPIITALCEWGTANMRKRKKAIAKVKSK